MRQADLIKPGLGSAGASAGVGALVGVNCSPQPQGGANTTTHLKPTADAAAMLGVFETAGGGAGVSREVTVGITYDRRGTPIEASREGAGSLEGELTGTGEVGGKQTIADVAGYAPQGPPVRVFEKEVDGTTVAITTYRGSSNRAGLTLKGGAGLAFGLDDGSSFQDQKTDGFYYPPGKGFAQWQECNAA